MPYPVLAMHLLTDKNAELMILSHGSFPKESSQGSVEDRR